LLDRLVDDTPEQAPEIFAARARIYADAGDVDRGLKVLDWGVLQYPDNLDMHYALAATYEQAGRVPEALRELSALLKDRPDDPAALNALGYTLADHDKHLSQARALIERAHAAAPKNAAILDSMGWVRFRQGKTEQALPYLAEAYTDDRGGDIAAHLGEVQWALGHQAEADRIWSAAAIVDPDNRLLKSTRQRMHALK
jgi:tetratricopeptide (TPR) repeat protein